MSRKLDDRWVENFKSLVGYIHRYNKLPDKGVVSSKGTDLAGWLTNQKKYYKEGSLDSWKVQLFGKYARGVLTKNKAEFNDSLLFSKQVNIPNKEYDVTVVELYQKGIITKKEYINFIKDKVFYFSSIVRVDRDFFNKGIKLVCDIPDDSWCCFYRYLFGEGDMVYLYLKDKSKFVNYYCKMFRKLESDYFTKIKPNSGLKEVESSVIEMYFGLNGNSTTIDNIAKVYNVSRARVSEVRSKALSKIRRVMGGYEIIDGKAVGFYEKQIDDYYTCNIDLLSLSVRAYNCLRRAGISSLKELHEYLVKKYDGESIMNGFRKIRNLGPSSQKEICSKIAEHGLTNKVFSLD